jgi:hypothetical protein
MDVFMIQTHIEVVVHARGNDVIGFIRSKQPRVTVRKHWKFKLLLVLKVLIVKCKCNFKIL